MGQKTILPIVIYPISY
uniref:Uncharacterized protein n=1 Tax=Arundo donax TaxID=35708 RepID=A0A0A8ZVB3_ARUDO